MGEESLIHHVIKILESLGLEPILSEKTEQAPFDVALVSLGMDEKERPLVLQFIHSKYGLDKGDLEEAALTGESPDVHMLHFVLPIPIEIYGETVPEVLRLLAVANKSFPLGCLNFSEVERSVYFTYSLSGFAPPPSDMTILLIINTILFAKETFFPVIEQVASAQQTVESLIHERA
jgi:hypothetical protein